MKKYTPKNLADVVALMLIIAPYEAGRGVAKASKWAAPRAWRGWKAATKWGRTVALPTAKRAWNAASKVKVRAELLPVVGKWFVKSGREVGTAAVVIVFAALILGAAVLEG